MPNMTPDNNDEPDEDDIAIAALELADEERAIEKQIRQAAASVGLANTWISNSNMPDKEEE